MITFTRPKSNTIRDYIAALGEASVSYDREHIPRLTESTTPSGRAGGKRFRRDHARVCLGHGSDAFQSAKTALRNWKMFPAKMGEVFWPSHDFALGHVVAVLFRGPGFWSLNPCRIIDRIDEPSRFGFSYGTLKGHLARGEETFLVERQADDSVWYDLTAFSRPAHWLAWLGHPIVRYEQARFRKLSCLSMEETVAGAISSPTS